MRSLTRTIAPFVVACLAVAAVPVQAQTADPPAPPPAEAPSSPPAPPKAAPRVLDLNSCTLGQLEGLPGLSEPQARLIYNGRPYKVKNDLVTRKIIPEAVYQRIESLVTAKAPSLQRK